MYIPKTYYSWFVAPTSAAPDPTAAHWTNELRRHDGYDAQGDPVWTPVVRCGRSYRSYLRAFYAAKRRTRMPRGLEGPLAELVRV